MCVTTDPARPIRQALDHEHWHLYPEPRRTALRDALDALDELETEHERVVAERDHEKKWRTLDNADLTADIEALEERVRTLVAERDQLARERDEWRAAFQGKQLYPISEMEQKWARASTEAEGYRAALEEMMRGDHHVGEHSEPEACDCTTIAARRALAAHPQDATELGRDEPSV